MSFSQACRLTAGGQGMNECRGGDEMTRVGVSGVILQVDVPYSHARVSAGGGQWSGPVGVQGCP